MLNSKFDLYRIDWLDRVFENRNKEYGAYELRQHYAGNMVRAMGIAFLGVGLLCCASIIFTAAPPETMTVVETRPMTPVLPPVVPPVKKITPPAAHVFKQALPVNPPATVKSVPPVVAPDPLAEKPVINNDIKGAIGTETNKGTSNAVNDMPVDPNAGNGTKTDDNTKVYDMGGGLDVMPMPVGGDAAWNKFLSKNLRFPFQAQEDGVSGKTIVSFIIEKDGSLSNITIIRPAGHGFDEEALRVLKLAKAWKPGIQNGQPVRVRYIIPINFQLSSDDR